MVTIIIIRATAAAVLLELLSSFTKPQCPSGTLKVNDFLLFSQFVFIHCKLCCLWLLFSTYISVFLLVLVSFFLALNILNCPVIFFFFPHHVSTSHPSLQYSFNLRPQFPALLHLQPSHLFSVVQFRLSASGCQCLFLFKRGVDRVMRGAPC